MKKKTVIMIAIIMSLIVLSVYVAICCIFSLFDNENKIYILGLVAFPLLPYILLLAILPTERCKLKSTSENQNSDLEKSDSDE